MNPEQIYLEDVRNELTDLIRTDQRLSECQLMMKEIEEFEQRIQKVEQFIKNDDLLMLSELVVSQLQGKMKLVRDMGKDAKT